MDSSVCAGPTLEEVWSLSDSSQEPVAITTGVMMKEVFGSRTDAEPDLKSYQVMDSMIVMNPKKSTVPQMTSVKNFATFPLIMVLSF